MGKGMGCVPSKSKKQPRHGESPQPGSGDDDDSRSSTSVEIPLEPPATLPHINPSNTPKGNSSNLKIYVIYYSMYGHVKALAQKALEGINSVEGVEGHLFQVPETLSPEILQKMGSPPKDESVPLISANEMPVADGFLFGFPTRFGAMAAQMKAFFDSTGSLWKEQKLAGKPAGIFVSTGSQGGGQETTVLTSITQLVHHGMLFVPIGYTFGGGMFKMDEVRGGSPYGAGTYAGDGSRMPNQTELELAEHQGKYTAGVVKKLRGNS